MPHQGDASPRPGTLSSSFSATDVFRAPLPRLGGGLSRDDGLVGRLAVARVVHRAGEVHLGQLRSDVPPLRDVLLGRVVAAGVVVVDVVEALRPRVGALLRDLDDLDAEAAPEARLVGAPHAALLEGLFDPLTVLHLVLLLEVGAEGLAAVTDFATGARR